MTPTATVDEKAEILAAEAARAKRNALVPVSAAPVVTAEQMDLITRTVAPGATPDELKLYLFDCARQGVHPLDKLIHFTVRKQRDGSRKYTPITSIDFMRIRAAETGEYAGSDDAVFTIDGLDRGAQLLNTATVTVWRLVQGQRCSFTATARWSEYKPEQDDFMWRKLPHTMLAKCAEALALRKGFPRQLAGLYATEEMDQAGPSNGFVEAPVMIGKIAVSPAIAGELAADGIIQKAPAPQASAIPPTRVERGNTEAAPVGERAAPPYGYVYIDDYKQADNGWHDVKVGRTKYSTKTAVGRIAGEAFEQGRPVKIESKPKENSPGEHWLNSVVVWNSDAEAPPF